MDFIDLTRQQSRIRDGLARRIDKVLAHGKYILGPEVAELESRLRAVTGAAQVVSCANGTDALVLILRAAGIGPGDAVFVPSFTFVATAEAVVHVGAVPIFVDVDAGTFNIDPKHLEEQFILTVNGRSCTLGTPPGLRPRAVIAVDLFGMPASYDELNEFCLAQGMRLIGDGAQSFGARYQGRCPAAFLEFSSTSFFPAKPLGCYGDGGAVFCASKETAELLRSLRVHGKGAHKYDNVRHGYNSRLDTMQAAVLLEKLCVFEDELKARQSAASFYGERLKSLPAKVITPCQSQGVDSAWAAYTIRIANRDRIAERLQEAGVPTAVYYGKGLHQQEAYAELGYQEGALPVTERLCKEVLSIPFHPYLTLDEQELVVHALSKAVVDQD